MTKANAKVREVEPALFEQPTQAKPTEQPKDGKKAGTAVAKAAPGTAVAKVRTGPLADEASDEIAMLLRVVTDPKCDVAKAERIEAMIERARAKRAENQYNAAFYEMQAELPEINKDNKIVILDKNGRKIQETPYASYDNIQRVTRPILKAHGFALKMRTEPGRDGVGIVVIAMLAHGGGHHESMILPLPLENSGSKNNVQGINSSISYGKRICTTTMLDLIRTAPQDADNDGRAPEGKKRNLRPSAGAAAEPEQPDPEAKITGAQAKELLKVIDECDIPISRFIEKYKVTAVHELPARFFDEAVKTCRDYAARVKDANAKKSG
jgi:ERF superfamily